VAEDVRRIVMGEINDTARKLLQEMGHQAEGKSTPNVLPPEAAKKLGLDPRTSDYEVALEHLRSLGDIEPSSEHALSEQGFYRLTPQGLRRARELRWWR
jgi:hypothetical protein